MPEVPDLVFDVVAGSGAVGDDGTGVISEVFVAADAVTSFCGGAST